jgi:hypothetical protein
MAQGKEPESAVAEKVSEMLAQARTLSAPIFGLITMMLAKS